MRQVVLAALIFAMASPLAAKEKDKEPRAAYITAKSPEDVRDCMVDQMGFGEFGAAIAPRGKDGWRIGRMGVVGKQHVDIEPTAEGTSVKVYGGLNSRGLHLTAKSCL